MRVKLFENFPVTEVTQLTQECLRYRCFRDRSERTGQQERGKLCRVKM